MPIPSSILYPALINAAGDPALLDILVELSQDADVPPEAELSSDDPEYLAASRRIERRMKSHLGMHSDDELEEAINAVSTSGFTGINQQVPPPKHLEESRQQRFSTTQFLLPDELTQEILRLSNRIPDGVLMPPGREPTPHITVKYGLHGNDPDVIRQAVENYGPVSVKLGKTSVFPSKETQGGYDVVKVDVDSDDLHGLNRVICDAVPHADMHPDYQPHVTLGYVQPGAGGYYAGWNELDGKEVTLNELVFSDAEKQVTRIPLGEGRVKPTTRVDDVIATLEAAQQGDVELTVEDVRELLGELSEDELEKVQAIFGAVMEGEQFVREEDSTDLMEDSQRGKQASGVFYDKNQRPYCLEKGKRTVCKPEQIEAENKKRASQGLEPIGGSKRKVAVKPEQETKVKPSLEDTHSQIKAILDSGELTDDSVGQIATALKALTVKDIGELKKSLGLKASGKKEELINKIAQKAVEGARKARESKQETKPVEQEPVTREPETPPEQPQQSVSSPSREFQKTVIAKAKDAGDFIPITVASIKKNATPEQRKQIDAALWEMVDKGILSLARHNHPDVLPKAEKDLLLPHPNGKEYFVDVAYIPEDSRAGYSVDGKWTTDEEFFSQQQEPKSDTPEQPSPSNTLSPLTNSLQSLRDNGGSQDDFIALGLNKLPVKELAKVAGELGVTSKDNSKTGLIRAIQRHVLEKSEPQKQAQEPSNLDDDSIVLDDDPVGNDDVVIPDDEDIVLADDDDAITLDDDPQVETATPRKPDKPKKIMADTILEDKVIRETVQQLAQLFDDEDIASSEQHQKDRDEQISKQRKRLSPQYQSMTVDELIALQPQLSEKLSRKGRTVKDKREDSENYNAIMQIAVASSPVMKAKPDQDKIIEKLTNVLSKNVTSPMKFQLGKHESNVSSEAVNTTSRAVDILGSIMQMRRSDVSVNFDLVNIESRAHYEPRKKYINTGSRYRITTAIHEISHAIEMTNPLVLFSCFSFLKHRLKGEKSVSLHEKFPGQGYQEDEVGRKDKFDAVFGEKHAYYVGKDYGGGSTEVLSMGLEQLFRDPVDFAKKDPEYVGFLIGILNGSISGNINES